MLQLCLLGKFLLTMWRQKIDSYFYGIGTKLETKHVSRSSLEKGSLCQAWKCHLSAEMCILQTRKKTPHGNEMKFLKLKTEING